MRNEIVFAAFSLLGTLPVSGRDAVVLHPGDRVTVGDTTVMCEGGGKQFKKIKISAPVCDDFFSVNSCQGLPIGTVCSNSASQGVCIQDSDFAGKPNCKCK
jgi:hypothetical protein